MLVKEWLKNSKYCLPEVKQEMELPLPPKAANSASEPNHEGFDLPSRH